jgi:four helix bundle suffix protein
MQFDPSGGFRALDTWVLASVVQLATRRFCQKFLTHALDPKGRQYDQMTQAARSGKANIAEGSARAATSKETEMKLTDVARASLMELQGDYEDWLAQNGKVPWNKNSPEARAVFAIRLDRPAYKDDPVQESVLHILAQQAKFAPWLESGDPGTQANTLIILLRRLLHMLRRQLDAQGNAFAQTGGFREKLTAVRITARAEKENAPACPECGAPMKRRKAKTGLHAGGEFWGCTAYPKCKATLPLPEN